MVSLRDVPTEDAAWLHDVAAAYFRELVPQARPLPRSEVDHWFQDSACHPLLIRAADARAGFALVDRDAGHSEMSEFCVLPGQRSAGIGTLAAIQCFERFPGPWTLGVASALPGTARFWDRLLQSHPGIQGLVRGAAFTPNQAHSYTFTFRDTS